MARKPDKGIRERILTVASSLFQEHGPDGVGLQQIINESGCGKNVLYREFGSKDELVVAYLDRCRQDWFDLVQQTVRPLADDPAGQLIAIVGAVAERSEAPGFRGCPLRNSLPSFPEHDHPARRLIVDYHFARRDLLRELAEQAGARDPRALADKIMLLIDGLHASGAVLGEQGAGETAVAFATEAVSAAVGGSRVATPLGDSRVASPGIPA
ncbi:TetR/AcrR family transcriptional regulator [Kribbella deserti]|uniref:TetR/AcrR family transcriptional regulator n=1 Tax=Kribbella deserti TaxID=1926257 RepID=A0ABV6QFM7_9ACTN